jgi:hypothetical protein
MKTNRQCLFFEIDLASFCQDLHTDPVSPRFASCYPHHHRPGSASLRDLCGFAVNSSHLVAGESEDIAMSMEWPADLLIMDESSGRAMARNLNIRITGTLGGLLKAKRDVQIPCWNSSRTASWKMPVSSSRTVSETRFSQRRGRAHENNHLDPPQHVLILLS